MRQADTYEERARYALEAALDGNDAELTAQIDAMAVDELYDLSRHAERLTVLTRAEWLNRVKRPAGES